MPDRSTITPYMQARGPISVFLCMLVCFGMTGVVSSSADTHFVSPLGGDVAPYTTWATAARSIQDAVDAATPGDIVAVTNGVYQAGSTVQAGIRTRVVINKAVTVRSVNGPAHTGIKGQGPLGTLAVRGVWLADGAVLSGFKVMDGHTVSNAVAAAQAKNGGGIWSNPQGTVSNCVITQCEASVGGGGMYGGVAVECQISNNVARLYGGGLYLAGALNSGIRNNSAADGGGAYEAFLDQCTLSDNTADGWGGGLHGGTANRSVFIGNRQLAAGNDWGGGGAYSATLNSCFLTGNSAFGGGGALNCTIKSCTITGNDAHVGGGVNGGSILNSIVYYNTAQLVGDNWYRSSIEYSCTLPDTGQIGVITDQPRMVTPAAPNLLSSSPCIGVGLTRLEMRELTDVEGDARLVGDGVDMGCDEYVPQTVFGPLVAQGTVEFTTVAAGFPVTFFSGVDGRVAELRWEFDDSQVVWDVSRVRKRFKTPGFHNGVLTVWNAGASSSFTVGVNVVAAPVSFVSPTGGDVAPYDTWAKASRSLQAAVDVHSVPGASVVVTNGVYQGGTRVVVGTARNRVVLTNAVRMISLNGPAVTAVRGDSVGPDYTRGAYLGRHSVLSGFTVLNGNTSVTGDAMTQRSGGGIWARPGGVVSNCVVTGCGAASSGAGVFGGLVQDSVIRQNSAAFRGGGAAEAFLYECIVSRNDCMDDGGGAVGGGLRNCFVLRNTAVASGGGVANALVENCTVVGNTAETAGGVTQCTMKNSIVYYNTVNTVNDNWEAGAWAHCCTFPNPGGVDIVTNRPGLTSLTTPRITPLSPCFERGLVLPWSDGGIDFEGEKRLAGDGVDIGADELLRLSMTGAISVAISADYTNVVAGFSPLFEGDIGGTVRGYAWDWGDGQAATNVNRLTHGYAAPGLYTVSLTAWNDTDRTTGQIQINVLGGFTNYVSSSGSHTPPFTSLATAATNIQDAIDANPVVGGEVRVANGAYRYGGRTVAGVTTRVVVDSPIRIRSQNGPAMTHIIGRGPAGLNAVRCVYLAAGAELVGFTLTNGHTRAVGGFGPEQTGGGAYCEAGATISNCVVTGCAASFTGGGVYAGDIVDSRIDGNRAASGGGVAGSIVRDSTLQFNVADSGAGAIDAELYDSVLIRNTAADTGGAARESFLATCSVHHNVAGNSGGGVFNGTIRNSLLVDNVATNGGGLYGAVAQNCTIVSNRAYLAGGGTFDGTLINSIVYFNEAPFGNGNWQSGTWVSGCTTPSPLNSQVITNAPRFVLRASGDYRLHPTSPCIDRGVNITWMRGDVDLDGNPRVMNGAPEFGAYEFFFDTRLRVILQGAYRQSDGQMRATLVADGDVPLSSPYGDDVRDVADVAASIVDWVQIELRATTNDSPVAIAAALLRRNGQVVNTEEGGGVRFTVAPGDYYVAIKHRNHVPLMTANPVAFTNNEVRFDYTDDPAQLQGGMGQTAEVEPGLYAMRAGDVDGDGVVRGVDIQILETTLDKPGYARADVTLNGVVNGLDLLAIMTNMHSGTSIVHPETRLVATLNLQPDRITVAAGDSVDFNAFGHAVFGLTTNTIHWGFVTNLSDATLSATSGASVTYQAGAGDSVVDIVEAWEYGNRVGRTFVNVIGADEVTAAGKAIIVAGGKSDDDPVWPATDYVADKAFDILTYRGFSKANIHYMSFDPNQDVDGNGLLDDIDASSAFTHVASAFTNWVGAADKLFVFLANHGSDSAGEGYFRLNVADSLSAQTLDGWLDNIQNTYTTEVTVVMDFCYAGSFLDELAYTGTATRVVVSSTADDELTYFIAGGQVSFSDLFFSGIQQGLSVLAAFELAQSGMSIYQTAWLDDTRDGVYEAGVDGAIADTIIVGPSFIEGKDLPVIGSVAPSELIVDTTRATLWADDISSFYDVERVWATVIAPSHAPNTNSGIPVLDIPELELFYNEDSGRYERDFEGFLESGTYKVIYYARDVWNSVSLPMQSLVTQSGYDERVLLVVGGNTNDADWASIDTIAAQAYTTFIARSLDNEAIQVLSVDPDRDYSGDGSNDVDDVCSLETFRNSITFWAAESDRLTLYLIGKGDGDAGFALNPVERLSPEFLDLALDRYQLSNTVVNVIGEFSGSGNFVATLTPPPERERIVIASSSADHESVWDAAGLVSFSQYFLSDIFQGETIGTAMTSARKTIRRASGRVRQRALIDDDGDGRPNEKNVDGTVADTRYLGPAFVTGDDIPSIGAVMSPRVVLPGSNVTLWASDVVDVDGISNVWCMVSDPVYDGLKALPRVDLTYNPAALRYEGQYGAFNDRGLYVLTFYAEDALGQLSGVVQSEISVGDPFAEPDAFENDDAPRDASEYQVQQVHTFHSSNDVDWTRIFMVSNFVYDIETIHHGTNIDTVIEVFYRDAGGSVSNVDMIDEFGFDEGELTGFDFPRTGFYFIKTSPFLDNGFTPGGYTLVVDVPAGGGAYLVMAVDALTGAAMPTGTIAIVDGDGGTAFAGNTTLSLALSAGSHTIEVPPMGGFLPIDSTVEAAQVNNPTNAVFGNPRQVTSEDVGVGTSGFATFVFFGAVLVDARVFDVFTGSWVDGADIRFAATAGILAGNAFDRYPHEATYITNWVSAAGGGFPSNVLLFADHDYDLYVSVPGYSNLMVSSILSQPGVGASTNLGALNLVPLDLDGNGIADAWEEDFFGTNTVPTEDDDGDGLDNLSEYLIGTDPTNGASVLTADDMTPGTNGISIRWPSTPGRAYLIQAGDALSQTSWPAVHGPVTAGVGETEMSWTDPGSSAMTGRFYRIGVKLP